MKCSQIFVQAIMAIVTNGNAETSCLNRVEALELKRDNAVSSSGMWAYFEKNFNLEKIPLEAIQLDSRINKFFFS